MKVVTMPHWRQDEVLTVRASDTGVYISTFTVDLLMDRSTAAELAKAIQDAINPPPVDKVLDSIDFAAIVNTEEE